MKRIYMMGAFLLLLTLPLSGCSTDKLLERGTRMLDDMFAGAHIESSSGASDPDASDSQDAPAVPNVQKPDIPEKTAVPDQSGSLTDQSNSLTAADPEPSQTEQLQTPPSQTVPEQTKSTAEPSAEDKITPSHTDATFFGPGENFNYLPVGTTGVYACEYVSENPAVASVDSKTGKVTAVGPGTTKIKMHVECNGQYDFSCIVRCNWEDGRKTTGSSGKKEDKKPAEASGKKEDEKPAEASGEEEPAVPVLPEDDEPVLPPDSYEPPDNDPPDSDSSYVGVTASHTDTTLFNPKESFRLQPVGAGDDYTCSYSTSNAEVAAVDGNGTVTAVGPGTATVTMSVDCGGSEYTFQCVVRCSW